MTAPNESKNQKSSNKINAYAKFSGIAFQMIAIIGLGSYGGVKLDESYPNKYSVFTIICSLLSVAMATYFVIKQAKDISNKEENTHD